MRNPHTLQQAFRGLAFLTVLVLTACDGGETDQTTDSLDSQAGPVELTEGAKYELSGTVEVEGAKRVMLEFFDHGAWSPMETAEVSADGSFGFSGTSEGAVPGVYQLQILPSRTTVQLILSPEPLSVAIDAEGAPIFTGTGAKDSEDLQELISLTGKKQVRIDSLRRAYDAAQNQTEAQRIAERMRALAVVDVRDYQAFLKSKAPSFISVMGAWEFLGEDAHSHADFLTYIAEAHANTKAHPYAKDFIAEVEKLFEPATPISLKTAEGKTINLSDYRGKVVMIDFWASWCGPCRAENPSNVRLYNKYKSKGFEILGVSVDDNREKWLKAVEADGLTWPQVLDAEDQAAIDYGVNAIPHTVLVGRDGRIIAVGLRGPELEAKLKSVL